MKLKKFENDEKNYLLSEIVFKVSNKNDLKKNILKL